MQFSLAVMLPLRCRYVAVTCRYRQVHMQFSLLGIERAYVTFAGRLHGVIRRSNLHQRGKVN